MQQPEYASGADSHKQSESNEPLSHRKHQVFIVDRRLAIHRRIRCDAPAECLPFLDDRLVAVQQFPSVDRVSLLVVHSI